MADLLKIALRGARCEKTVQVGSDDVGLVCDLSPDHVGPLHYDSYDQIWWYTDA